MRYPGNSGGGRDAVSDWWGDGRGGGDAVSQGGMRYHLLVPGRVGVGWVGGDLGGGGFHPSKREPATVLGSMIAMVKSHNIEKNIKSSKSIYKSSKHQEKSKLTFLHLRGSGRG